MSTRMPRQNRATIIGRSRAGQGPGLAREASVWVRERRWWQLLGLVVLAGWAVAIGAAVYAGPFAFFLGGAAGSAAAVLILFGLRFPQVSGSLALMAGFWLLTPSLGAVFAAETPDDPAGAAISLVLGAALVVVIAHLTSLRNPTTTVGLALLASVVGGLALKLAIPSLNVVIAAGIPAALVLLWRSGVLFSMSDSTSTFARGMRDKWKYRNVSRSNGVKVSSTKAPARTPALYDRPASDLSPQVRTEQILRGLPSTNTVFNAVEVNGEPVDHVVIGPAGLTVIRSVSLPGVPMEDPVVGWRVGSTDVVEFLATTRHHAQMVSRGLRGTGLPQQALLVIHDSEPMVHEGTLGAVPVALYDANNVQVGSAHLVTAEHLMFTMQSFAETNAADPVIVSRVARRGRGRLRGQRINSRRSSSSDVAADSDRAIQQIPAATPMALSTERSARVPAGFAPEPVPAPDPTLDLTGLPLTSEGQEVTVMTDQGLLPHQVVASEPWREHDTTMVLLCSPDEWEAAYREQRPAVGIPHPLGAVIPV
jgi:hypothetical protein